MEHFCLICREPIQWPKKICDECKAERQFAKEVEREERHEAGKWSPPRRKK